jgi:predicted permease
VILPTAMPVFVVAFLGYLLARAGRPFDDKTVTFIVGDVGAPALIFYQLTTTTLAPDNIGRIAAATALAIA